MKNPIRLFLASLIGILALCTQTLAREKITNGVIMKGGQVKVVREGKSSAVVAETILTDGTKITSDGLVLYKNGDVRTLKEGDALSLDGVWVNARQGMLDHGLIMKDGKMMIFKGGKLKPMEKEMNMADGTKVKKDGTVMTSDGASAMMNEGDTMSMDGSLTKAGM